MCFSIPKFIKLTLLHNGEIVAVNPSHIASLVPYGEPQHTVVGMVSEDLTVKENIHGILNKIKQTANQQ